MTTRMRLGLAMAAALTVALPASGQGVSPSAAATAENAFPGAARIAFVDFNRVAALSAAGKAMTSRLESARSNAETQVDARGKEVLALEAKLAQAAAVTSDEARVQLRRQFERAQVDFQRLAQDVQAEVQQVQRELEQAFLEKAAPVIDAVAKERALWAVFSASDAGILWREPSLDLSDEIARRMDVVAP